SSETGRWNAAIQYTNAIGPVHFGLMYSPGSNDAANQGADYGANIGFKWKALSVDAVYEKQDSIVKGAMPGDYVDATTMSATIEDTSGWSVMGKYVFDLGGSLKDGGS